jgi:hypothetical protein
LQIEEARKTAKAKSEGELKLSSSSNSHSHYFLFYFTVFLETKRRPDLEKPKPAV